MSIARWFILLWLLAVQSAVANALDDYVHRPDPTYGWTLYHKVSGLTARHYFLRLSSQQWLSPGQVDRTLWEHELRFTQPRALFCGRSARESPVAVLIISGGKNKAGGFGHQPSKQAADIAQAFCRPVLELRQVPNQPLRFADESITRQEDGLIAYSFDRYLRREPGDWPLQFAMVKAVVQAMTAAQAFSRTRKDIPDVDEFVLMGASKRGWTTWLTAAVDRRVRALVPVSIDMLDLAEQLPHHFAAYGDYARALADYKAFDLGCRFDSARGHDLLALVDPLAYNERLTQPVLILNSAGDEFFVSDSWRFYYDRLHGDKRLRYTVNSDHRQGGHDQRYPLFLQARNWLNDLLARRTPPQLFWQQNADGVLEVRPSVPPHSMTLWVADNPHARDFRRETLGPVWTSTPLSPDAEGRYRVLLSAPLKGWRASVVEAVFGDEDVASQQIYTTGVYVTPDRLPYAGPFCPPPPRGDVARQ